MIKICRILALTLTLGLNANAGISPSADSILPDQTGQSGKFLATDGTNSSWQPGDGMGTVTSVGLSLPSIFNVSGSPITAAGTLTGTFVTQSANRVFAGPVSGGAATPTFRALVAADIPSGFANDSLSNLTSTAINQDLLPGTSLANSLGSSIKRWLTAVISSISTSSISAIGSGDLDLTTSGGSSIININPGNIVDFNNKPTRNLSQVGMAGGGFDVLLKPAATPVSSYSLFFPPAQGALNQILKNDGSGNLSWASDTDTGITQLTGDVTAGPGSGSQAATVVKLQGVGVSASSPSSGQVLKYDGSNWAPGTDLGITALTSDVTASGVGSQAATVVKIQGRSVATTAPSNNQVLKWNAGATQWEPGAAASGTWASTKAYSTDTFISDNSLSNATAISYPSGGTGSDAARYIATDDNDGSTGDGSIASLNIQAGTYTGTGAFTSITGGDLNLFAGANHQTGAPLGQVTGGNVNLYAGTAVGSGDGGQVTINGGVASHGGNGNGGPIIIAGGSPSGTGQIGPITLTSSYTQMNSPVMVLPTATSDAAAGAQGWFYYNTSTNQVRIHDASVWKDFGASSGDPNTMAFFNGSGNLSDQVDFTWDGSSMVVPGDVSATREVTNATVSAGSFLSSVHATTNGTYGAFGITAGTVPVVDTGVVDTTLMAGIQSYFTRNDIADAGTVANGAGIYSRVSQNGTNAAAHTNILAGIAVGSSVNSGTVDSLYDLYFFNDASTDGTITNRYGIYLDVDGNYTKDSWLSGRTQIGGTSFSAHSNALKVSGDMSAEISVTDSGAAAGTFTASSNTTTNGSNTTLGINGAASGTVQVGAENDKVVGGMNFAVTRGDGTDQGILDAMTGANALIFHNSDTAGVTNNVFGFSTLLFSQNGTVTNLYDYYSMRVPAGSGVVTNHYGIYLENDSTTPVKNWLSGSTQFGGSSFTVPTSTVEVNGALGFLDSGFQVSFVAPTLSASTAYTWPAADGGAGDVLSTDGGGVLSWVPQSGGSPTGDPNTVAFFDGSGNLTDQTDFAWDGSTMQVPGNIMPEATGTRNIGSSSVEYLAGWARAIKGITNVLVQAVSGTATIQGTTAVTLSNGTNNVSFTGTSFNPSVNNAISLGGAANNIFSLMRARNFGAGDGTSTLLQMDGTAGQTFPGGQAISAALRNSSNSGTHTGIFSSNSSTANTVATGNLYIGTGNKTAGNANSGDMILRVGTPFGTGVRGTLALQDGSEGTAHYLWTSSDTTGKGSWVGSLKDSSSVVSVDYLARQLNDSAAALSVDYEARQMFDSSGNASEDFTARNLYTSSVQPSIDWENHFLFDNGGQPSLDFDNRQFVANDGSTVVLDYSNAAGPNFNSTVITNPAGGTVTVPSLTGTLNVSDARVTTSSLIVAVVIQNDATAKIANVVPHAGNFDINMQAAPTLNTSVRYVIFENPQ